MREPRPDFLIIGAAKAGTSSLHEYLGRHPGLFGTHVKEPSFFSYHPDRELFRGHQNMHDWYLRNHPESAGDSPSEPPGRWDERLREYLDLFAPATADQLRFESSTNYTRWPQYPDVPARIASLYPDIKLIYLLRHPVERAYSHYVHRYSKELHQGEPFRVGFEDFIEQEPVCIDSSRYMTQINKFLEYFPAESLLCVFTSDLQSDTSALLRQIFEFLGVDPTPDLTEAGTVTKNVARDYNTHQMLTRLKAPFRAIKPLRVAWRMMPGQLRQRAEQKLIARATADPDRERFLPPPMAPKTRSALIETFRDENRRLAEFLGVDLSAWDL